MYCKYLKVTFIFILSALLVATTPGQFTASAQHEGRPSKEKAEHDLVRKHLREASDAAAQIKALASSFKQQRRTGGTLTAADNHSIEEMRRHARNRSKAFEELIAEDPETALQAALTPEERSQFPSTLQAELESDVDLEGDLEVLIVDNFAEGISETHHTIVAGNERYSLHFAEQPPELMSGSKVRVKGLKAGKRIAVPHK